MPVCRPTFKYSAYMFNFCLCLRMFAYEYMRMHMNTMYNVNNVHEEEIHVCSV